MKTVYLYAAEFSNGVVKVGRSTRPEQRRVEHATPAAGLGLAMTRWATAPIIGDDLLAEQDALAQCAAIATSVNMAEWFVGVAFDAAVDAIKAAAAKGYEGCEVRKVIRAAGGPAAVARLLNIRVDTVRSWETVPERHRKALERAGRSPGGVMAESMRRVAMRFGSAVGPPA